MRTKEVRSSEVAITEFIRIITEALYEAFIQG